MTHSNSENETKKISYWRSQNDLAQSSEFLEIVQREFPEKATELEVLNHLDRRKFLGILSASMALAGVATTGCIRRPREHIYPQVSRPEGRLPGIPEYYSTTAQIGGGVLGLVVTSTDGRPTKIDGNPRHTMNQSFLSSVITAAEGVGPSNSFAQAEILNMYDPDKGQKCLKNEVPVSKKALKDSLQTLFTAAKEKNGQGVALIYAAQSSPSFTALIQTFQTQFPKAIVVKQNTTYSENRKNAFFQMTGSHADVSYDLSQMDVLFSVDCDFMGLEGDSVKYARQFSEKRKITSPNSTMNRLYCIEPHYSTTGTAADHHYALQSAYLPDVLLFLVKELSLLGLSFPNGMEKVIVSQNELPLPLQKWLKSLAADLYQNKGAACILVGDRHPPWVHAFGYALNVSLGVQNKITVLRDPQETAGLSTFLDLQSALEKKAVQTLVVLGGNPVYTAPVNYNLQDLFKNPKDSFYLGESFDETAAVCEYYIPHTHFLEAWGDTRSLDGTISIRQPLIAPLFEESEDEYTFLNFLLLGKNAPSTFDYIKNYWKNKFSGSADFDLKWRQALSDGLFLDAPKEAPLSPAQFNYSFISAVIASRNKVTPASASSLNLEFYLSKMMYDGRYSNNAWMQETPDPIHKLVWDNALLLSSKTARSLGLNGSPAPGKKDVDLVTLEYEGRSLDVAVFEVPGIPDMTLVLQTGYGRSFGRVALESGFNANTLRTSDGWFGSGAQIRKTGRVYPLVSAQEHGYMNGTVNEKIPDHRPPVVREATLQEFKKNPKFILADELLPPDEQKNNLFKYPKDPAQSKWARQQWGMSIDLNSCIGCNACTVACQSENNISVVGKEEVFRDREMYWIRLDRYFTGDVDNPEIRTVYQPLGCQQCENAPCEAVCPVAATTHSADGLNDMTYNRCVGTRYCANNCPYKVRKFNFFNYSKMEDERNPLYALQKNPNVTVRFRGVMEKCTYCVQRINAAKAKANKTSSGLVPDGGIVTACQSVCPTNAIVFGDVADPNSAVSKLKTQSRNYSLLGELNTKPRTTYLAKLRNTNPLLD